MEGKIGVHLFLSQQLRGCLWGSTELICHIQRSCARSCRLIRSCTQLVEWLSQTAVGPWRVFRQLHFLRNPRGFPHSFVLQTGGCQFPNCRYISSKLLQRANLATCCWNVFATSVDVCGHSSKLHNSKLLSVTEKSRLRHPECLSTRTPRVSSSWWGKRKKAWLNVL